MKEEEKLLSGKLFCPGDPELRAIKLRSHDLCARYNRTFEEDSSERAQILDALFASHGRNCFIQGPLFIHYGTHTRIGDNFFGNFNLTIQDDATVDIGDNCNFGPNVTIVTPVHPMLPDERRSFPDRGGTPKHMCFAKPVVIGSDCWFGANVVVCPGVTIGDGCVVGAGSVVTRDIPPMSFAAGVPCRVLRPITDSDSLRNRPELFAALLPD
jgi:maltose O-acetyltransferase